MVYDISGNNLIHEETARDRFEAMLKVSYKRDETTGAFYTLVNIPQTNLIGEKQYPFVMWPNSPNGGTESALELARRKGYMITMNAGRFYQPYGPGVTVSGTPTGTVIQNGQVLRQGSSSDWSEDYVLTINNDGRLGYAEMTDSATDLIEDGVVSAVSGFIPLLDDYVDIDEIISDLRWISDTQDTQRQVLGQY